MHFRYCTKGMPQNDSGIVFYLQQMIFTESKHKRDKIVKICQVVQNIILNYRQRSFMSKQQKLDQHTFLHVKQRLDYYRLPSSFPIQVTSLLSRLLGLLDVHNSEKMYEKENLRYEELKRENKDYFNAQQSSSFSPLVDEAMRMELSKHVKDNNQLHQKIMTLKQELSALKHVVSKTQMNNLTLKNTKSNQNQLIEEGHLARERELFDELQDAKYKYNQVIDMVHSQSNTEQVYIKKLLKHKQYCSSKQKEINPSNNSGTGGVTRNDLAQRQVGNSIEKRYDSKSMHKQVQLLREKLQNREKQILRLRGKLQFDGLNMNRILKDFNEQKRSEQRDKVMERVEFLQRESKKVKEENLKMKALGGDKQALREEVERLKCENSELKRKVGENKKRTKELEQSEKKEKTLNKRKLNETAGKLQSLIKQKTREETRGGQLQKKEKIYEEKITELSEGIQRLREENSKLSEVNSKLQKQLEEEKLMGEYERQKYMHNEHEIESRLRSNLQMKRGSYFANQSTHINTNDNTLVQNQQFIQSYKQQLNQMRHKLITKQTEVNRLLAEINNLQSYMNDLHNQLQITTQTLNTYKQHLNITKTQNNSLKTQNNSLKTEILNKSQLQNTITSISHQLQYQKDQLEKEKKKNIKSQLKLAEYEQINDQFTLLKEQYTTLQKGEKQKLRGLQYKIAQMQETVNIKTIRNEEKQTTITSLQTQLIESNNRLRQANKQLSNLDEELHKLKIDNNRLEKKYNQLMTEYAARQQKDKNHNMIKESQLMGEMETLNRELQKNKTLVEDRNTEIHEHQLFRNSLEKEVQESQKQVEEYRQEIENFKQRQQLYEMEIRELKIITDSKHI